MPTPPRFPSEVARLASAALDLLGALRRDDDDVAALFQHQHARIAIDTLERSILISVVDDHGRSLPLFAIVADPGAGADFGAVGRPEPVFGLHDLTGADGH